MDPLWEWQLPQVIKWLRDILAVKWGGETQRQPSEVVKLQHKPTKIGAEPWHMPFHRETGLPRYPNVSQMLLRLLMLQLLVSATSDWHNLSIPEDVSAVTSLIERLRNVSLPLALRMWCSARAESCTWSDAQSGSAFQLNNRFLSSAIFFH